ncbi:MAG: M13 family metallopeptidase [Rikenellaceae bacterium]
MKKLTIALVAFSLASCAGSGNKAADVPAIDLANLDTTTAPSHDFYQYATGGWQERTPLKDEFSRYGAFDMLRENNEIRINELFAGLTSQENEKGSVGQKIADLYKMGLDSIRLNEQGAAPVMADLKAVEAINTKDELTKTIAAMHREIANPFFGAYISTDLMSSNDNIMYISQSGLSMGTKDYYVEERYAELREKYQAYIEKLFSLAGYTVDDAARIAKSVMTIELAIAEASSSNVELRDNYANYNMMTIADFKAKYDALNWDLYAETIGFELPTQINVGQLRQMAEVNNLLKNADKQELKDYLAFNALNSATSYMSDDIYSASFDFYGREMSGREAQQPRWKRSLAVPNGSLGEAVGEMYVAKYFPAEYKAKMLTLVGNLQKALSKHIADLDWMSDVTKAKAQEKLSTIYIKVGYPDKWKDYSSLNIDPALSYWENIKAISRWGTLDNFADLGKAVDRDRWGMTPQTINAYYNPTTNEICFPAAILQPPFFNPTADDAVNYGAIGVVIGHEMTHGFDDQGRQFDKDGNLNDWWTAEDAEKFEDKTKGLIAQFDAIEVLPGIHANGAFTLGENIADQGGLRVAYTAMQEAKGGVEPEAIDGFTAEQRFYLGYATVWAQNIRDKEIERLTNIDPHSLGEYRVNQTLKNIDTFYEAFGITEGGMFLASEERVVIW